MPLLERESPLASLVSYAADARRGNGRLVLMAGEAGVGKSALVDRLASEVPEARWSRGACDGLYIPRPLGPLFDLAGQLGGELGELCRDGAEREALFGALLRRVSEPEVLDIVVIEDVHWADEATVDLLRFLGRRLRDASVLLIATFRDDEIVPGDLLRAALGDLARQRSTRRVQLAPLSADAVAVLAAGSQLEAAELYRLTGGNPFYVTEALQAGIGGIPASARDAVLARAVPLSGQARAVLDVAALIGTRAEMRLVEAVTGCPAPAVDELLASGLLAVDDLRLKFRHEIARLAVGQAIAAHRAGVIHGRILAALRAGHYDDDARLAFHAEAARDGAAVLRYAPAAGRRAAELASHREAAAQFERALRFAVEIDPAIAARLYDALAQELSLIDRWQDAADARQRALALWRIAGDPLREGDRMRRLSRTMWRLCRGHEALAAADAALAILQPLGPSTELAWACADLAAQRLADGAPAAAVELARRAQAMAEPLGAFDVLSDALNTEGCAAAYLNGGWAEPLRRALAIAMSEGLEEQAGRAFGNTCMLYASQRLFAEAEQTYVEGIAYCDEHDIGTYATCLRGGRTLVLEQTARWDEAMALSAELLSQSGASPINRISPLVTIGVIRARRGESGAWDYLDQAIASAEGSGEPQQVLPVRLARAEASWLAGRSDAALREAELADDVSAGCDSWERGAVGVWLRRTGSGRSSRGQLAEPYRLQLDGYWEKAAQTWAALDCPYEAAMAQLDASEEGPLREALSRFTDLSAMAAARITRHRGPSSPALSPSNTWRRPVEAAALPVMLMACGGYWGSWGPACRSWPSWPCSTAASGSWASRSRRTRAPQPR